MRGKGGVVWGKAEPMCRNELVMYGKERETSGKVVKTFLRVVVWDCLVGHRLRLLDGCCCIRTWGGLCIRECGRTVSELRAL